MKRARCATLIAPTIVFALLMQIAIAALFAALPMTANAALGDYNAGDIQVIYNIKDSNGLSWPDIPDDGTVIDAPWMSINWPGVTWTGDATDKRVYGLDVSGHGLTGMLDVTGLSELMGLNCSNNNLTALNVSSNTRLQNLSCFNNNLAVIDLSSTTELRYLHCFFNNLTELDLSGNTKLVSLICAYNSLINLYLPQSTSLDMLVCYRNNLDSLDVTGLSALLSLFCDYNNLTELDVSGNPVLRELDCTNNNMTDGSKVVGKELTSLPPIDTIISPARFRFSPQNFFIESGASDNVPVGYVNTPITEVHISGRVYHGTMPYTYSISGPTWLAIDSATGIITGTRPASPTGATTATISVTDSSATVQLAMLTIAVGAVIAPDIPPPPPPPSVTSLALEARKEVSGGGATLEDGQFEFAVFEGSSVVPAATGTNDASGAITFTPIEYSKTGTYTYTIKETSSSGDGWTVDAAEHTVMVTVTNENGRLVAKQSDIPIFTNHYTPTVSLRLYKILLDDDGNKVMNNTTFGVHLFEETPSGSWNRIGRYDVPANGAATVISNLPGENRYQIVEETADWYKVVGFHVATNSTAPLIVEVVTPHVSITIPELPFDITVHVGTQNLLIGEPGEGFDGGEPIDDPTNIEIEIDENNVPLLPFTSDHIAYIVGYPEGNVRPNDNVTRAEVATVFYRLLTDDLSTLNQTQENPFADVQEGDWFNTAISVMSKMEILQGYEDGTFRPNESITRAQMAAIAARFARMTHNTSFNYISFVDIDGHWANEDIRYAAMLGLVRGYDDGTYNPNGNITRAELMTLVNRMLGRVPETPGDLLPDEMVTWTDNLDTDAWYYLAVQEATNSHIPGYKGTMVEGQEFFYEYWIECCQ